MNSYARRTANIRAHPRTSEHGKEGARWNVPRLQAPKLVCGLSHAMVRLGHDMPAVRAEMGRWRMDATAFHARRAAAEHRGSKKALAQDAASEPEPLGLGRITRVRPHSGA